MRIRAITSNNNSNNDNDNNNNELKPVDTALLQLCFHMLTAAKQN